MSREKGGFLDAFYNTPSNHKCIPLLESDNLSEGIG